MMWKEHKATPPQSQSKPVADFKTLNKLAADRWGAGAVDQRGRKMWCMRPYDVTLTSGEVPVLHWGDLRGIAGRRRLHAAPRQPTTPSKPPFAHVQRPDDRKGAADVPQGPHGHAQGEV